MKKLQCESCGGLIDRETLTCRSCGMQYQKDYEENLIPFVIEERKTDILHGKVTIPDEILAINPEERVEFAIHQLANNMARNLIPYLELERESNPRMCETEIYARLRVVRQAGDRRKIIREKYSATDARKR